MRLLARPSLRSVLTLQAGLVIFLAVFICAASLFVFSVQEDRENLDNSLLLQGKVIAKILGKAAPNADHEEAIRIALCSHPDEPMAEIRQLNGRVAKFFTHSRKPILLESGMPLPRAPFFTSKDLGGVSHRVVFYPAQQEIIAIAAEQEPIREALQHVLVLGAILTFVLLIIILAGGRWLASQALAPIVEMASATEHISAVDTSRRLPGNQADVELRRLAAVLNAMLDRLHASFSLIRRFTADAAHEIKTPLTIIHGQLEGTLREEGFSSKQEASLLLTLREVERLNCLVEGLLLLSRSDAGRLDLVMESVDWSVLAEELLHDADILAQPLGLQIRSEIMPGLPVSADRQQLRQVMLNLLDNACKYNHSGGTVEIALRASESSASLEIGNSGPGIAAEAIPFLFERFQRGETSRTRNASSGLGLGLSICREIIRAHGGTIELAESSAGWTRIRLTLLRLKS